MLTGLPSVNRGRGQGSIESTPVILVDKNGDEFRASSTRVIRPTITVQATPDYADGDCIGGLVTLSHVVDVAGRSGSLRRFGLRNKLSGGILVQTFMHIFDSFPNSSTFDDNAALVIAAADQSKILKTIAIAASDWVAPKGASPWYTVELLGQQGLIADMLEFQLSDSRDMYFAWEADGAINFASAADAAAVVSVIGD